MCLTGGDGQDQSLGKLLAGKKLKNISHQIHLYHYLQGRLAKPESNKCNLKVLYVSYGGFLVCVFFSLERLPLSNISKRKLSVHKIQYFFQHFVLQVLPDLHFSFHL